MGSIRSDIMISIMDSIAIKEMLGLVILMDCEIHLNQCGSWLTFFLSKRNFYILTRLVVHVTCFESFDLVTELRVKDKEFLGTFIQIYCNPNRGFRELT
jgi:hypothetical protein